MFATYIMMGADTHKVTKPPGLALESGCVKCALEMDVRLISGIDTAMPDVKNDWSNHAAWNQNDRL